MAMNPVVQNIVDQIMPFNPEKIILFGSYANGKPNPDSDVDIMVVKKTNDSFSERQKKVRLMLQTTTPVDVFVLTPEEFEKAKKDNLFIKEISEFGKVVYG